MNSSIQKNKVKAKPKTSSSLKQTSQLSESIADSNQSTDWFAASESSMNDLPVTPVTKVVKQQNNNNTEKETNDQQQQQQQEQQNENNNQNKADVVPITDDDNDSFDSDKWN